MCLFMCLGASVWYVYIITINEVWRKMQQVHNNNNEIIICYCVYWFICGGK